MDFISKLFWSAIFFGIGVFIVRHFEIGHTNASLVALFLICFLYAFIPDISIDNPLYGPMMFIIAIIGVVFYFIRHYILPTLLIFGGLAIFYYLSQKKERISSLPAGILFALPLWFINPIYAIFGFLGFFSVWFGEKIL
ncbi:MAG: hypothetical protein WCF78_04475 [archaeon]